VVLAVGDDNLRRSLNVDSDSVGEIWMLNGSDRSLQVGVEGYLGQNSAILALHDFVNRDLGVLKPLDEGNFGAVSDRDVERVLSHLDVS